MRHRSDDARVVERSKPNGQTVADTAEFAELDDVGR